MEAAFFDLDKTVIARASMVAFGGPLRREGLISRRVLLRALWGQLLYLWMGADDQKVAKMRETALHLTKGWEVDRIRRLVRETLAEVVDPIVFDEALELIAEHKAAGRVVAIVSASPIEIVEPLTEYLGADRALATRAAVDETGRYTGEMEFYCYGPHKVTAMVELADRDGIDLARSWAYSDSASDVPMLEAVGHPVAVNPDRELASVAHERDWEVRHFLRRVHLGDRVSLPSAKTTVAVGGGMSAVAAAGAATWWWLRRTPSPPPSTAARVAHAASRAGAGIRRRVPSSPRRRRG